MTATTTTTTTTKGSSSSKNSNSTSITSSNGGANTGSSSSNGRERAMEILLDRDLRGSFFRAARVVEEAVPAALRSRPNLVTKTALIEQAYALDEYDVDTLEKDDDNHDRGDHGSASASTGNGSDGGRSNNKGMTMDAVTKERIFHHQGRIAALKKKKHGMLCTTSSTAAERRTSKTDATTTAAAAAASASAATTSASSEKTDPITTTSTTTTSASSSIPVPKTTKKTPLSPTSSGFMMMSANHPITATVVTALRQVFDETSRSSLSSSGDDDEKQHEQSSFDLKNLLRKVTSNAVLQQQQNVGGGSSSTATSNWQGHLENLILQTARQSEDDASSFHALFIAILCLIMGHENSSSSTPSPAFQVFDKTAKLQQQQQPQQPEDEDDASSVLSLQVASLLSLLPAAAATLTTTNSGSSAGSRRSPVSSGEEDKDEVLHPLSPEVLSYFGQAAAAYEERLEIQKARLLAHLPSPRPSSKESAADGGGTDGGAAATAAISAKSPTLSDSSSSSSSSSSNSGGDSPPPLRESVRDVDDDDDEGEGEEEPVATAASSPPPQSSAAAVAAARSSIRESMTSIATLANADSSLSATAQALDEALLASLDERAAVTAAAQALSAAFEQVLRRSAEDADLQEEDAVPDAPDSDEEDDDDDDDDDEEGDGSDDDDDDDDEEDSDEDSDVDREGEDTGGGIIVSSSSADDDIDTGARQQGRQHESSPEASDREAATLLERAMEEIEGDDDAILRQALSLSLAIANTSEGAEDVAASGDTKQEQQEQEAAEATETAVVDSASTDDQDHEEQNDNNDDDDDDGLVAVDDCNLPSLPNPPPLKDLSLFSEAAGVETDGIVSEQSFSSGGTTETGYNLPTFLDPSALARFGALPASYVLIHLLRYATTLMEKDREESGGGSNDLGKFSVVPGGMGSMLFNPAEEEQPSRRSTTTCTLKGKESEEVSFQLAVATLLLVLEKRNDAIENLSIAIAREQQADKEDDAASSELPEAPLSSGEEDDPALTLALNYVEDDVPLSSESLENKGMRRKAAALAHDTAAVLRSLRKRTDTWKGKVKLYSHAAICIMRTLRLFLRNIVRRWLSNPNGSAPLASDFVGLIPSTSKLSEALEGLMSVSLNTSYLMLLDGDEKGLDQVFLSLELYLEAAVTWGEFIPVIYPSEQEQSSELCSLIDECSRSKITGPIPHVRSFDSITAFPSSELEIKLHKLQIICRRLRMGDLLEKFVARPLPYSEEKEEDTDGDLSRNNNEATIGPHLISSLMSSLCDALSDVAGARNDLQRLYLALCHRCHTRILLMDGLYGITETEMDDPSAPKVAAKSLSTGDTVKVSSSPSTRLLFDSTKCSDSIAIFSGSSSSTSASGNGAAVHQRASKVWGGVLATQHFNPKSGVHHWAVRLDKCERGHVFVGVATAQASMKTYIGGDKYGWGMIGTQALWHDRRKIRGDYGSTFRTGSTIIVTLDTDAGTLSFSSWKDSSLSPSFSLDSSQGLASPRRQSQIGGTIEDWGIAFEGLPLDSRLYPAVGLYQRDDRVTLLTVESGSRMIGSDLRGECYFPRLSATDEKVVELEKSRVRQFNDILSWEGVEYTAEILKKAPQALEEKKDDFLVTSVLPSLAASLCLVPKSVPILSARIAMTLMPHLKRCILALEHVKSDRQRIHKLFRGGPQEGKWAIRATGSSAQDYEEYIVDFKPTKDETGSVIGFEGTGVGTTGKSKNGLVSILGAVKGSSLTFVEKWSDGNDEDGFSNSSSDDASSCVVSARLSLDGKRFEGMYRNVQYGTAGQIAGVRKDELKHGSILRLKEAPVLSKQGSDLDASLIDCEAVLCLAYSHMVTIVGEDPAGDLEDQAPVEATPERLQALKDALSKSFLSSASLVSSDLSTGKEKDSLRQMYAPPILTKELHGIRYDESLESVSPNQSPTEVIESIDSNNQIAEVVSRISSRKGKPGSFSCLCPDEYAAAQRSIACVLLHVCGYKDLSSNDGLHDKEEDELLSIWNGAQQVVEDGVRKALSKGVHQPKKELCSKACNMFCQVSRFIQALEWFQERKRVLGLTEAVHQLSWFYSLIENESDIECLKARMSLATRRGLVRLVAFQGVIQLLSENINSTVSVECLCVGLPHLMGHGQVDSSAMVVAEGDWTGFPLGGHYLSGLAGASCRLRASLLNSVYTLNSQLGMTLDREISARDGATSSESVAMIDSLVLSVLAIFVGNVNRADVSELVSKSGILNSLPKIFSAHREASLQDLEEMMHEEENGGAVRAIQAICQRDISQAILRCSAAVAHVISYQASCIESNSQTISQCLGVLLGELDVTFPLLELHEESKLVGSKIGRFEAEIGRWSHACHPKSKVLVQAKEAKSRAGNGATGVNFLMEHGSALSTGTQAHQPNKPRQKTPTPSSSRKGSSIPAKTNFSYHYLSQLLHILSTVLDCPASLSKVLEDSRWQELLLKVVGLTLVESPDGSIESVIQRTPEHGILPANFRSRVLRLILPLLRLMEPSQALIEGLITLAGSTSNVMTHSLDDEEGFVSREAVSLVRQLHFPASSKWRLCINNAIHACSFCDTPTTDSLWKRIGVLSFFSGDLVTIRRGSYVLLKPPAAVALSQEHQASPGIKGHSSAVGGSTPPPSGATPHHIVGNGTESVVAGLCRFEASAGIVSNIDMKNGVCEVILLSRNEEQAQWQAGSPKASRSLQNGRPTLTVRALRTPLSDVVLAQEVPLLLDESIPWNEIVESMLLASLNSLLSAASPDMPESIIDDATGGDLTEKGDDSAKNQTEDKDNLLQSGMLSLSSDLMVLRSCIVILSDNRLLSRFIDKDARASILSKVLLLAWPECKGSGGTADLVNNARGKFISSLPVHEARYSHLRSMLRNVAFRLKLMQETSETEWRKKLEKHRALLKEDSTSAGTAVDPSAASASSPRTLPSSSSSAIGAPRNEVAPREADSQSNRSISQSTGGSISEEEEDESGAAATAAAHLREAAIAQMAELGLPRSWSELALRRTGGTNIEAAVTFCLERGAEMERLLAEERERERMLQRGLGSSSRRRTIRDNTTNHLLRQLQDMGFPARWCAEALAVTGNNVDEALTWILTNGERLSEEDEGMEVDGDGGDGDEDDEDSADEDDEEDEDEDETEQGNASSPEQKTSSDADEPQLDVKEAVPGESESSDGARKGGFCWTGSIIPLRFISGRATINPESMEVSGLPTGGFSSVGTKGVLLTSGKWYYEAILETAGCLQIGWADGSFAGHCNSDRGDGCGDGPSSWAYDGWRRYRWHSTATEWGCRWKEGDTVGCLVDMDDRVVSFTLNGQGESVGMGVAFSGEGFRPCGGVYACVSFNRREKLRLILGGKGSEPFKYAPPSGYHGVGEAVLEATEELETLLQKESVLDPSPSSSSLDAKKFLCDFSDGEHGHELMAWAHRYYGSDASVHLGSGRPKLPSGSSKSSTPTPSFDVTPESCLSRRLELEWSKNFKSEVSQADNDNDITSNILIGYKNVQQAVAFEIVNESVVMAVLLARKLLLHVMVTMGIDFDLRLFVPTESDELPWARLFWNVVESSASLRSVGWVGEAGAMAVAAEALGLGISSNEHIQSRSSMERVGVSSASDLDNGLYLPTAGITQLLSSVIVKSPEAGAATTGELLAAGSEAAIGSDSGGGLLTFLRESLQGAACRSSALRKILLAVIRRSVRILAVVEYDGDSEFSEASEDEDDYDRAGPFSRSNSGKNKPEDACSAVLNPDARLIAFLSGLLLSKTVLGEADDTAADLAQAWSLGLLSASLPWRMICGFTVAGILNHNPSLLSAVLSSTRTLTRYYGRLPSTVARRIWAERAASPVCSRHVQAMVELLASVKRAVPHLNEIPQDFSQFWNRTFVDAATPLPIKPIMSEPCGDSTTWEAYEGWVSSDSGWEIWSGTVEYMAVDWKIPSRSGVRTLMDAGQGPPMVSEGCLVVRGADWNSGNVDGNDGFEAEKAKREKEKRLLEEQEKQVTAEEGKQSSITDGDTNESAPPSSSPDEDEANPDPADPEHKVNPAEPTEEVKSESTKKKKKRKKIPSPKLPVGTVLSVEPWNGVPAMARRVRWHLTGEEGVYRYGADGGRYDICHVETNDKQTRIRKRHPLPESAEQTAARHGFGARKVFHVLLRLAKNGAEERIDDQIQCRREGILEWPDFASAVRVSCILYDDGAVSVEEKDLLYGSKDSGWEVRFGQPSYCPGSIITLAPTGMSSPSNQADLDAKSSSLSMYEELLGSTSFTVKRLKNKMDGSALKVTSEMRLFRGRRVEGSASPTSSSISPPLPLSFDKDYHAASISLSSNGRTATCIASDGRGTAFASVGFTKGVHYWEVKLEQADIGSVFIGVAEKPSGSGSGSSFGYDSQPRLNRWHGWGFVNFRATYTSGAERVYGAHCHAGDTVGVLLDCDAGRVSFFFDGLKYGEHILNDLGCAFENLSPFGFNVDGCGSGGAGQGAPSGFEGGRSGRYPTQGAVRPRTLWPVIGLRNQGDRVTVSSKWNTSYGVDGAASLRNILAVDEILNHYLEADTTTTTTKTSTNTKDLTEQKISSLPSWFVQDAFSEYKRWYDGKWSRSLTRGSGPYRWSSFGLDLDLDASPTACAAASAGLGLSYALLAGDCVRLTRSAGRILELAEEAVVLGAYQGRLYYQIASQKSEGGSLTEGGGRAWCWDESEVVDGLPFVNPGKGAGIALPKLYRFKCLSSGGLRVVYEAGAVLRSDLEIFDGSSNLGTIPVNTVIPRSNVLERRVNSCGVVRYRVIYGDIGEGWISARIRGGKEEMIVEPVNEDAGNDDSAALKENSYMTPDECAGAWYIEWRKAAEVAGGDKGENEDWNGLKIQSLDVFEELINQAIIPGLTLSESDSILSAAVSAVSNFTEGGDAVECPFREVAAALSFALASSSEDTTIQITDGSTSPAVNQAVAAVLAHLPTDSPLPPLRALLARMALLKAFNRMAKYALPWLSLRPCQEGSAILGGLSGHGTSTERAGRTRVQKLRSSDEDCWVQVPSIASRIRTLRGLFFTSVKRSLLTSIVEATTTPTPLSHDEYELPREIRTVRINRLKAARAMASQDSAAKRKYSVFAQLQSETRNWGGASLRRGHVAKGHGGQKRAFKVKLVGEGVNDYSGPYREAFTDAINELLQVDDSGSRGALGVLDPTPNNSSAIGDNRDLYIFSLNRRDESDLRNRCTKADVSRTEESIRRSFSSLMAARDEPIREVEEALVFLGRLTGTAFRHGIPVDLPLAVNSIWKALAEEPASSSEQLQELDYLAYSQLDDADKRQDSCFLPLLWWQKRMLNSFAEGLSNVLPVEVLPLLSGEELRDTLCGNPEVDVDLLKRVVEYEGYEETDDVIGYFWETLREFTNDERKKFLQFVWARNRLPMRESDFDAPFKIQKDAINTGENDKADQALPSASTCFFSLTLPRYSSQQILKSKLLFAINNVTTMETDFQTNSAEISEGYRTFW